MNFHLPSLAVGIILALIIATGGLVIYNKVHPAQSIIATTDKAISGVATEAITTKAIIVYRDAAKKKLDLPQTIQNNKAERVTGAIRIPANSKDQTVTVLLNTETGATDMFTRTDPSPWLAREKRTTVSLDYGVKRTGLVWRLSGREDLLQIKAAHLGLVGSIDGDSTFFVGLGVSMSW